jgi:hypothetical protein
MASTKILLNGVPGRRICHSLGLRQGDLLSPMLFVLVMECFHALIYKAESCGLLEELGGNSSLPSMLTMRSPSSLRSSLTCGLSRGFCLCSKMPRALQLTTLRAISTPSTARTNKSPWSAPSSPAPSLTFRVLTWGFLFPSGDFLNRLCSR